MSQKRSAASAFDEPTPDVKRTLTNNATDAEHALLPSSPAPEQAATGSRKRDAAKLDGAADAEAKRRDTGNAAAPPPAPGNATAMLMQHTATQIMSTDFASLGAEECLRLAAKLAADAERARTANMHDYSTRLPGDIWYMIMRQAESSVRKALRATCRRLRNLLDERATKVMFSLSNDHINMNIYGQEGIDQTVFLTNAVKRFVGVKTMKCVTVTGTILPEGFHALCMALPSSVARIRLAGKYDRLTVSQTGVGKLFAMHDVPHLNGRIELDVTMGRTSNEYERIHCNQRGNADFFTIIRSPCGRYFNDIPIRNKPMLCRLLDMRRVQNSRPIDEPGIARRVTFFMTAMSMAKVGAAMSALASDRFVCSRLKVDMAELLDALDTVKGPARTRWEHEGRLDITVRQPPGAVDGRYIKQALERVRDSKGAQLFAIVNVRVVYKNEECHKYEPFMKSGVCMASRLGF